MTPEDKKIIKHMVFVILVCTLAAMGVFYVEYTALQQDYMSGDDPHNPLKFGHLNISQKIKLFGDRIVDKNDTPHDKTMRYMIWIDKNINLKAPPSRIPYPQTILDTRIGLCGDFAYLTAAFLATQNIPVRAIGMYNWHNSAHAGIEVFYDDAWHYYDPTYSAYWYSSSGEILSFNELKHGGAYNASVYVYNTTRTNEYRNPEIYVCSNPSGVLGQDNPFWWPLALDLKSNSVYELHREEGKQIYTAGSDYIGASYINNNHIWTITNLTKGENYTFKIYPLSVWGADWFILLINDDSYIIEREDPMETIYYNFTATNTTEFIRVHHRYTGPNDIIIPIKKYEIV